MSEAVRLVVWDLDETFWRGTLTEGGIEYQHHIHDLVVELAKRGIMSSICSKNDYSHVKEILVEQGIWDYFIFPSINWQPKGGRLARLIEDVQLRPATVMFIDDNPLNRHEALQRIPGIQVADEKFIDVLRDDSRFRGKEDHGLKRLAQYKLLERRQSDQQQHEDNTNFLRSSGITVSIEFDIEPHIDRAVELINRTNQLNFTKRRLPEDPEAARNQLLSELNQSNVQAGLVAVTDNYGDYGYTGFYLLHVHTGQLTHFCFSCRTLGMGIETWLFERLRRPTVNIVGEVLTDLYAQESIVDWINIAPQQERQNGVRLGCVLVRGSCEMQAIAHYVGLEAQKVVGEFGFERNGLPIATSHTLFLRAALDGLPPQALIAAADVGLEPEDFCSAMTEAQPPDSYIFSFWADGHFAVYQEPNSGLRVPFGVNGRNNGIDLREASSAELAGQIHNEAGHRFVTALRDRFEYCTWSPGIPATQGESLLEENLRRIFSSTAMRPVYVILACEAVPLADGGTQHVTYLAELNRQTRRVALFYPNVHLLPVEQFFQSPSDVHNATHFDRRVYYRIYKRILELHDGVEANQLVEI